MRRLRGKQQEFLGVLFETFALLHEHYEFDERVLVDVVIALNDQISDDFAKSCWILVINTDINNLI